MHPPIDDEIQAVLQGSRRYRPSLARDDIAAQRVEQGERDAEALRDAHWVEQVGVEARSADGETVLDGVVLRNRDVSVRSTSGLLFIHGGGLVSGTRFSVDGSLLQAIKFGLSVASFEYRLAPEHPYPAALDDCEVAWAWLVANASKFDLDRAMLGLAGSSAGGGLAAGLTLRLRDRARSLPHALMLFAPVLDDRQVTDSSVELDGEGRWDRWANAMAWDAYLGGGHAARDVEPYAAVARAENVSGFPPTFIDLGDVETFRDENLEIARRLSSAGVPVELHMWAGGVHSFANMTPASELAERAIDVRLSYVRRRLMR